MLYSDLNLDGLHSGLIDNLEDDLNVLIPEQFTEETILSFNKRCINGNNINELLSFCDFLMIDDTQTFMCSNMEPSWKYILNDYHNLHYELPGPKNY